MEYTIHDVARAVGTTSRTLRHYDSIGLVSPSRVGHNGYRYYDNAALVRLQRVLLLRQLGLGLDAIRAVLDAQDEQSAGEARILSDHLAVLRSERRRITDQIGAVERTIAALEGAAMDGAERDLMEENVFEGFDHTRYRDEVEDRWGKDAYARSDAWWRGLGSDGQKEWQERVGRLSADWVAAAERGEDPSSPAAQELASRHVEWLSSVPGTPAHEGGDLRAYVLGLGEMYVADERFAANYGGSAGAAFVRDALRAYFE
ncbi:MerR family transcriptional regulator [Microbacterium sorbitolivorans]|uniref:MerR family transcriptional regulator n=1 Tax=Microbacterium sorbitolivorans TaxID=1867410 RepID=A0A367Y2I1_9MICO|nr:TipAS antibiotic-recognition domain-containing protein [Microbacterium sorbitolivorans]RCK60037.1 MerR family transcriptional regulator [Microbacterium sorbitolivorans]GGF42189.1 MerR family transcriptional regulator [Microbacterium sorbitolivorans]